MPPTEACSHSLQFGCAADAESVLCREDGTQSRNHGSQTLADARLALTLSYPVQGRLEPPGPMTDAMTQGERHGMGSSAAAETPWGDQGEQKVALPIPALAAHPPPCNHHAPSCTTMPHQRPHASSSPALASGRLPSPSPLRYQNSNQPCQGAAQWCAPGPEASNSCIAWHELQPSTSDSSRPLRRSNA